MMDNQFPGSDQIRQMQNLAALLAQYFTPGASQVNNFSGPPGATTTTTTNNNNNNNNAAPSQPTQPPQPLQQPQPTATPSAPSATSGADSVGGPRTQVQGQEPYIQQAIKLLRQQQQRQQQQRQQFQQQHQQQQQQLVSQEFTQRLQQQLHQIVQQSQSQRQQQQLQPSHSQAGEPSVSLTARQQQSMNPGNLIVNDQQKRKRGRPPLSKPSTSAGTSAIDFNYANVFAAVKKQQERDKESKLLERQRELRKQQELERQQEIRLAQERQRRQEEEMRLQYERQRLENERQRKAHHRMAMQDIERERRRQHMVMLRNLDAYKKNVEKEKLVNEAMVERNKQNERRIHQKRLEVELIKELRKPIDDMNLKNHQPLATFNRIPGLKLPGKAFADLLMSFEFLFNFSETIGLEPKTIPDINTLQQGLLNLNTWAEDQLCSILHHLCMFAVKDPRFPYTGSTKEIENLEATNEGLSQLLHFYLQVLTLNAKTEMEHEVRLFKLIEQKYFLALNATQKAEMLAFICNELLCSQTVTKQMEDTIENVAKLRKDKWVLENELRKFRAIRNKRELKEEAELKAKEEAEAFASNMNGEANTDEDAAIAEGSNNQIKGNIKKENDDKGKSGLTNGSMIVDDSVAKKENDTDTSTQQNITNDLDDLEPAMTNDELNRKIDNLIRQYNKTSNKLERAIHSMRASPLGQDRYRRRYWVLPQVGGVFVEGMESSEPEELENNKFTEEELEDYEKEQQALKELAKAAEESAKAEQSSHIEDPEKEVEIKDEKDDEKLGEEDMDTKEDGDEKDEDEVIETKDEEMADASEIREEIKSEPIENGEAESDKIVTENVTEERAADVAPVPNLWFSILPRDSCDFTVSSEIINETNEGGDDAQKKVREEDGTETKTDLTDEELKSMRHEICPALSKKLEEFEAQQYELSKKIHPQFQYGWWRITDCGQLKTVLNALHERGTRERILHKHLMKNFNLASTSCKNTTVDFEITSFDRQLAAKNYGAPVPHTDEDSADDLRDGEEEDEEEEDVEELDEETADDKAIQPASAIASKKSKRKKTSRSARSRRLRARAAARKKVENSKNKLAQR